MEDLAWKMLQWLAPIGGVLATWLLKLVADLIRSKVQASYLQGALLRLDDVIGTVVRGLEQTLVSDLREAAADGKLTPEEKQRIRAHAFEQVKQYLGAKGLAELAKVLGLDAGGLSDFLLARVEAGVHAMKTSIWVATGRDD